MEIAVQQLWQIDLTWSEQKGMTIQIPKTPLKYFDYKKV